MILVNLANNQKERGLHDKHGSLPHGHHSVVGLCHLIGRNQPELVLVKENDVFCSDGLLSAINDSDGAHSTRRQASSLIKNQISDTVLAKQGDPEIVAKNLFNEIERFTSLQAPKRSRQFRRGLGTSGKGEECGNLVENLSLIGWDKVLEVDDDFEYATFQASDASRRVHQLRVNLKTLECMGDWSPISIPISSSLKQTIEVFENSIQKYSPVWDELDIIDKECMVLDPPLPAPRAIMRRRLAILDQFGTAVSSSFLEINFSLSFQKSRPCSVDVIGMEAITQAWRSLVQSYQWSPNLGVLNNLTEMFKAVGTLRPPTGHRTTSTASMTMTEELARECGVCYSYRLHDPETQVSELPDVTCPICVRPYHRSCILGWLRALPSTRRSFNILVGECPYCSETMTVKDI